MRLLAAIGMTSAALVLGGCASELTLTVSVRSDLAPGTEFVAVVTELGTLPFELGRAAVRSPASSEDDFVSGKTLAPFVGLDGGEYALTLSLRDSTDAVIVERLVYFELEDDATLDLSLASTCSTLECPITDTCVDGRCTDPACSPLLPSACD